MIQKKTIFLLFILLNLLNLKAAEPEAVAKIDSGNVLIGEQIDLEIYFKDEAKSNVLWPSIEDSLEGLEIIDDSGINKFETDSGYYERRSFVITSFDSGSYSIPAFTFVYEKEGFDDPFISKTNPLSLTFNTVQVDTSADIKDIKAPLDAPLTLADFLPYIIAVLVIGGVIYLVYFFLKKRKIKKPEEVKYDPKIPPHIMALEALNKLQEKKLWQNGEIKQFYVELTEIIRIYIERRYEIDALEMVTDDIIEALKSRAINSVAIEKLHDMFRLANLAKFAKHQPVGSENQHAMEIGFEFVEITKPKSIEKEEPKDTK